MKNILAIFFVLFSFSAFSASNQNPNVTYAVGTLPIANGGTGSSLGGGAINGLYAPRFVAIGDSITAGSTGNIDTQTTAGTYQIYGASFANLAPFLTNGRVRLVHNGGIGGTTSTQAVARWSTSVAQFNPDVVNILESTNDCGNGISLATSEANIKTMVGYALAQNAVPILGTIPPGYDILTNPTCASQDLQFNAWLRAYAAKNKIRYVDYYKLVTDPITGTYKTRYNLAISATGGTYTITVAPYQQSGAYVATPLGLTGPVTTASIAYNATAAQVQTAIKNASSSKTQFVVTGPTGGPYNLYSADGYPFVVTTTSSLTGGAGTATLTNLEQYSNEGVHPSIEAQVIMATALAQQLNAIYPDTNFMGAISDNNNDQQSTYLYSVSDSSNLLKNACMTYFSAPGDTTGSLTDFSNPSSVTWNYVQDNAMCGNVLNITSSANAYELYGTYNTTTGYAVGDTIAFMGRIQTAGYESTFIQNTGSSSQNSLPKTSCTLAFNGTSNTLVPFSWSYDADGVFYEEAQVPTGTTSFYVYCYGGGAAGPQMRVSDLTVVDLTTTSSGN